MTVAHQAHRQYLSPLVSRWKNDRKHALTAHRALQYNMVMVNCNLRKYEPSAMKLAPGSSRPEPTFRTSYMLGMASVRTSERPRRIRSAKVAHASSMKRRRETFRRTAMRATKNRTEIPNRLHVVACTDTSITNSQSTELRFLTSNETFVI